MILSDKTLKRGDLISPLTPEQIQPNSVDLTLSNVYRSICQNGAIDLSKPIKYSTTITDDYTLYPKQFVLAGTNEKLNIPNGICGEVCGRSSIARAGLKIESAGHVDAGFKGVITLELFNMTEDPIILHAGMRIAQIYFIRAEESEQLYNGKYQGDMECVGSRIYMDFAKEDNDANNDI